ncbi:MAG: type IV pilus modification protein PilV [Porticoccus sp.]|nr:type IV pilus modification protein PilV [Porticoccus sp.]MBQ0807684.1 type IV pilus modification protein PilV [Porticoccus sp.]
MIRPSCRASLLNHRPNCVGVGLIEVMIAALVLAVGVLGYVGLQMNAKRLNFEAIQRTAASYAAQNLLERIRGNPTQISVYVVTDLDPGIMEKPEPDCTEAQCSSTQLAEFDLWEWDQLLDGTAVSGGLVNPTACVTDTSNYITAIIVWQGKVELNQTNAPACGDGNYGDEDKLRQWVTISTFVAGV